MARTVALLGCALALLAPLAAAAASATASASGADFAARALGVGVGGSLTVTNYRLQARLGWGGVQCCLVPMPSPAHAACAHARRVACRSRCRCILGATWHVCTAPWHHPRPQLHAMHVLPRRATPGTPPST